MNWRAASGERWALYADGVDPDARDAEGCGPVPAGEVGHIDGRWYGVPTGTLVQDLDGWHVPTFDDPLSAAAELGARLGADLPPFLDAP
jgi:hypothetical protein